MNLPHLSLMPNSEMMPPPPHTLEELAGRDHQPDVQTRSCYSKPIDELKINNLVYGAVLPEIGNSQKLQVKWSGFFYRLWK